LLERSGEKRTGSWLDESLRRIHDAVQMSDGNLIEI
jgi:hypothetical protein